MRKWFIALLVTLSATPIAAQTSSAAASAKPRVGIYPAYNASGEVYGPELCQHLTRYVFDRLRDSSVFPVLLNPGGLYISMSPELANDYAREQDADAVLVMTFKGDDKTAGPKHVRLIVESTLLDLSSGSLGPKLTNFVEMKNDKIFVPSRTLAVEDRTKVWEQDKELRSYDKAFRKQPLGKAAENFADAVSQQVTNLQSMISKRSFHATALPSGDCDVTFEVAYLKRKANSKSYAVAINDQELSLWVNDGIVHTKLPSGIGVVEVTVRDKPYKVPIQELYQANTIVDCMRPERRLILAIGSEGEAQLVWQ